MGRLREAVVSGGDRAALLAMTYDGLLHPLPPAGTGAQVRAIQTRPIWGEVNPPHSVALEIEGMWSDDTLRVVKATPTRRRSWFDQPRAGALPRIDHAGAFVRSHAHQHLITDGSLLWIGPSPLPADHGRILASVSRGATAEVEAQLGPLYGARLRIVENPWTSAELEEAHEFLPEIRLLATSGGLDPQGRFCRRALFELADASSIAWEEAFPEGMIRADALIAPAPR